MPTEAPHPLRHWHRLSLALLLVLGLILRLAGWLEALRSQHVVFHSPDAYYHMRRVLVALHHPAEFGSMDLFRGLGNAFPSSWPIYYDWAYALWIQVLTLGQHPLFASEFLAAVIPPLLGIATAAYIFGISRRFASPVWALIATGLYLMLPRNVELAIFAETDHSVAEVLCLAGLLYHLLRCLDNAPAHRRWAVAWMLGMFLCWNGSVLHVGVLALVWLLWGLRQPAVLPTGTWIYGLTGLLLFPFYLFGGDYWNFGMDYLHPSFFHPLALLVMSLSFDLLAGWRLKQEVRWLSLAAWLVIGGLLALEVLKGIDLLYGSGGGYPYAKVVAELQPLLDLPPQQLLQTFSWPGLLAAPAAIVMLTLAWRKGQPELFFPAGLFGLFGLQTLHNQRFLYMVCMLLPFVLIWMGQELSRRLSSQTLQTSLMTALPLAVAASVWPLDLAAWRSYPTVTAPLIATAHWIGQHTPVTGEFLHPHRLPDYSLLAPWDMGHMLLYETQRPVVSENFGLNSEVPARFALTQTESEGIQMLQTYKARYLLLSGNLLFSPQEELKLIKVPDGTWLQKQSFTQGQEAFLTAFPMARFKDSLYARLFLMDGSDWLQLQSPGLDSFRLLYESPEQLPVHVFANPQSAYYLVMQDNYPDSAGLPMISLPSRYKFFEHVRGARLQVQLKPEDLKLSPDEPAATSVLLECPVLTNSGRHFYYRRQLPIPSQGHLTAIVPYAQALPGQTGLEGPCQLQLPQRSLSFDITEADVQQGRIIDLK